MSTLPGPDEEIRPALLRDFREVLVSQWPGPAPMQTILSDAGLNPEKYIIDTPRDEDRWYQAIKRIDRDNKLIKLIDAVRGSFDQENDVIERLYAAELAHSVPAADRSRIFVCYRREDTAFPAGWLFDKLAQHFGPDQVFKDVNSILLGDNFVEEITAAVGSCAVLLALIGDRWLTVTDESSQRRLDDPGDFVRMEIEAALQRNVRVVPILVGGARMPRADDLPPSLAKLTHRQALELSHSQFDDDISRLLRALDRILGGRESR